MSFLQLVLYYTVFLFTFKLDAVVNTQGGLWGQYVRLISDQLMD